ncbi:MAG: hypothetical protein IT436_13335 [Phycisphaerales bacterium]|nr:hypothetical protein [Phycisphaerales bacterium]
MMRTRGSAALNRPALPGAAPAMVRSPDAGLARLWIAPADWFMTGGPAAVHAG